MKQRIFILAMVVLGMNCLWAQSTIPTISMPLDTLADIPTTDSIGIDTILPQRPNILDQMPHVVVQQDSLLAKLLHEMIYGSDEPIEVDGYRVQIYSSNRQQTAKSEALQLEKELTAQLSIPVYVFYMPPFWKVRLGNFRSYEEANDFKIKLIQQFPNKQGDIYIVRDKILVQQ